MQNDGDREERMTPLQRLAHELRQPLTAILSNAQAAQRLVGQGARAAPEVREILEEIVVSDKRAARILRELEELLELACADVPERIVEGGGT
jgi:two-component system sensor kinase FixL